MTHAELFQQLGPVTSTFLSIGLRNQTRVNRTAHILAAAKTLTDPPTHQAIAALSVLHNRPELDAIYQQVQPKDITLPTTLPRSFAGLNAIAPYTNRPLLWNWIKQTWTVHCQLINPTGAVRLFPLWHATQPAPQSITVDELRRWLLHYTPTPPTELLNDFENLKTVRNRTVTV